MKPIQAVLVDDELSGLKTLEVLLKKYCPDVQVIAAFSHPHEALTKLSSLRPDLLFLDIEMPELTGLDFMTKLPDFRGGVIFVTAYSSYAVRAFQFSALHYLLKPVDPVELKKAVTRYKEKSWIGPNQTSLQEIAKNTRLFSEQTLRKIAVSTNESVEVLPLNDILYLKADRNYTLIVKIDGKGLLVAKTLKEFEELLRQTQFMRTHSSFIVNMDKVARFVRSDGGFAEMVNGAKISISRDKKEEFLNKLKW